MSMSWEWIIAVTAGGILGVAGKFFWKLIRRLTFAPEAGVGRTIYLEPQRAKEILRELERKREETLQEIDSRYADRRRAFLDYLDAQSDAITADLRRKQQAEIDSRAEKKPPGST